MSDSESRWAVAILAAGKGTRMRSEQPKVLHELAGRPLIDHVIDLALGVARPHDVVVVVGHGADEVGARVRELGVGDILQEPQLGTGDALRVALEGLEGRSADHVLVLSGDVPLLRPATLRRLMSAVTGSTCASVLTAELDDPGSYGRIDRDEQGFIRRIVEARDADPDTLAIREVNAGVYAFHRPAVTRALAGLGSDNVQGEYYLTDVAAALRDDGGQVAAVGLDDPDEMQGVNTRADLARASRVLNDMVLGDLMEDGVSIRDPLTTWIDPRARVGREVVIEPGVVVAGACRIGDRARIGANSVLVDAAVGSGEVVRPLTYLTGE
jgi:bifunctional UDP-N-acetylglucosamine pyrophosphorylase/glucosamine-1-phosphate N-acetyltransferase